jgi:hypothetical protein
MPREGMTLTWVAAGALGHLRHGVGGVLDVPNTGISVMGLIEAKTVLPVWL